uniref:ATP synthase complex subunit 8 n=1 Tax=Stemonopa insignis TaxID=2020973 RepID=A0A3Q8AYY3_9EUCA|nr:ATP synthase F0 subunit 8 [Stemonopa insignis]
MPQMAPLMWMNLMFIFLITFMVILTINYFNTTPPKMSSNPPKPTLQHKLWSW